MSEDLSAVHIENIPNELQELTQWVCWQAKPKSNGKLDKIPINPATGRNASHSNPKSWGTFQQALARYRQNDKLAGIGFVFSKDDPYTGVDLDTCRDHKTGNIEPWALQIIQDLASYTEISPSGTGLHVISKAALPGGGRKNERLEIYSSQRFFTITGEHLGETPVDVLESQKAVTKLYGAHFEQAPPQTVDLDDAELLARAFGSKKTGLNLNSYLTATGKRPATRVKVRRIRLCQTISPFGPETTQDASIAFSDDQAL